MSTCVACRKRPDSGRFCYRHLDQLGEMLDPDNAGTAHNPHRPDDPRIIASIPVLWARLDAQPVRRAIDSPALGGFLKSTPPGDLHVMSLRDGRSTHDGAGPDDHDHSRCDDTCKRPPEPLPVETVLRDIVARVDRTDIDGRLETRPGPGVEPACAWLYARREWLAAQGWAGDAWEALRALWSQLRGACGDPLPRPLGPCIREVDEHWRRLDGGGFTCGWQLYLPEQPPKGPDEPLRFVALRCGACGDVYAPTELVLLVGERVRAMTEGAA